MMKFTTLVIALVLAPGLHSATVTRNFITTYPLLLDPIFVETRPLPLEPELRPEVAPVIPETKPLPVAANPCEACFSYMATLIDQLTETVEPQLPEFLPESPVGIETLPQPVESVEPAAPILPPASLPLPIPGLPVGVRPLPILTESQAEVELAAQNRPLPEFIIR